METNSKNKVMLGNAIINAIELYNNAADNSKETLKALLHIAMLNHYCGSCEFEKRQQTEISDCEVGICEKTSKQTRNMNELLHNKHLCPDDCPLKKIVTEITHCYYCSDSNHQVYNINGQDVEFLKPKQNSTPDKDLQKIKKH